MNINVKKNRSMRELIEVLSPLRMAPNSAGLDQCVEYLKEELDFIVHEVEGGTQANGWIVPQKWEVIEAEIRDDSGKVVYDGMHHPLAVIGYSQSFKGSINGAELKKHLFYSNVFDDALIYHCDLFYKPFRKEWGFSVPKLFRDTIRDDAEYSVRLKTEFESGTMKIAEYVLPGDSEESIVINAHNCHAFCCNDDLAGVAAGVEVIRRLSLMKNRKYTYRLIVAPEHFGSIFYLHTRTEKEANNLKYATFLEMVGAGSELALQRSFQGNTLIDRSYLMALQHNTEKYRTAPFRKVVGNDETCWDAAGYDIPCPSLSRSDGVGHFPEYHTSKDSPDLIEDDLMEESVKVVMETLFAMEKDATIKRKFKGLVALSHPDYDLYKSFWDPSEEGRKTISVNQRKWNYLMDCIPRYFDGETRIIEIAERHELPFRDVYEYVMEFYQKGLVEIIPASGEPLVRRLPPY